MNVPNLLTGIRLALVPIFIYSLTRFESSTTNQWIAGSFYFFAAMTDVLDGYLARKHNQVTNWGKIADPIADKALTGAAFIGLSMLSVVAWWMTVVILSREALVTLLRFIVIRKGVIPASRGGKAKTLSQNTAIVAFLLPLPSALEFFPVTVMYLAVGLTIVTGLDYVNKARALTKVSS